MRFILAIQAFFALLFTGRVPAKALPPPQEPEDKKQERERLASELAEAKQRLAALERQQQEAGGARAKTEGRLGEVEGELETSKKRVDELEQREKAAKEKLGQARDDGALAVLAWLQREGRLIDFLMEDIETYEDEQVGAAVRAIHKGCRKVIDQGLGLEAILEGEEESPVEVPVGFDPVAIQLTGNVKGDPPFKGTLMHHGWRTRSVEVPVPEEVDTTVLAPAEVEL